MKTETQNPPQPEPPTIPCEPMGRGGMVTEVPNPNYVAPEGEVS